MYFGLKEKRPLSPLIGAMWYRDLQSGITHEVPQHSDDVFGYYAHDGISIASQNISHQPYMNITTNWAASDDGWAAAVKAAPLKSPPALLKVLVYVTLPPEAPESLSIQALSSGNGVTISGMEYPFTVSVDGQEEFTEIYTPWLRRRKRDSAYTNVPTVSYVMLGEEHFTRSEAEEPSESRQLEFWQVEETAKAVLAGDWHKQRRALLAYLQDGGVNEQGLPGSMQEFVIHSSLPNNQVLNPRVVIVQFSLALPLSVDMRFGVEKDFNIKSLVSKREEEFHEGFMKRFPSTFGGKYPASFYEMATSALSNTIGGIGYFNGMWLHKEKGLTGPSELLTGVPTRAFFPRGFLWDEGFHLLLISAYNETLAQSIIQSWIGLVDEDGWIGREQILGGEARSRVPSEFQVQDPSVANPPTLFLAVQKLLLSTSTTPKPSPMAKTDSCCLPGRSVVLETVPSGETFETASSSSTEWLVPIYPQLKRHAEWYLRTQASDLRPGCFAWNGRTATHCLPSGLDDYPRASWVNGSEGHVDIQSWMIVLCKTMATIALQLDFKKDHEMFSSRHDELLLVLDEFWDDDSLSYADIAAHPSNGSEVFIQHTGYVSFFPLMLKLVDPSSDKLGHLLSVLEDPTKVWSRYGIRSLSTSDSMFGTGENYWRGPIWMNVNYLILGGLKHYAAIPGPHQDNASRIYKALRSNVVANLHREFKRTGFLWEQYHPETGRGQRARAFNGWTALVLLIIEGEY